MLKLLSFGRLNARWLSCCLLLPLSLFGFNAIAEEIVPTNSIFTVSFISEHRVNEQSQPEHVTLKILSQPDNLKAPLPEHCLISGEATLNEATLSKKNTNNPVQVTISKLFCITAEKEIWDLNASGQLSNKGSNKAGISTACLKQEKAKCVNAKLVSDKTYQLTFSKAVDTNNVAVKPSLKQN